MPLCKINEDAILLWRGMEKRRFLLWMLLSCFSELLFWNIPLALGWCNNFGWNKDGLFFYFVYVGPPNECERKYVRKPLENICRLLSREMFGSSGETSGKESSMFVNLYISSRIYVFVFRWLCICQFVKMIHESSSFLPQSSHLKKYMHNNYVNKFVMT